MQKSLVRALALALAVSAPLAPALAQPAFPAGKSRVAPAEPDAIPLYPDAKDKNTEVWTEMRGELWARNVTRPTLTPYLPAPGKATGTAVLVVPGGGFKFVSMSNEGWPIAQWLADQGIAAFVLKYRVDQTPPDEAGFGAEMAKLFGAPPRTGEPDAEMQATIGRAREDAQVALRMIRANASKWGVDTKRVGMLGFSAGAMTTMATTLADAPDARPDFIAPIYGFMTPVTPPPNPQPMFVALASDDPLFGMQGYGLAESWKKAGGSVEMHVYAGGSHGFGSHRLGTPSDQWFNQFVDWMKYKGLVKPAN